MERMLDATARAEDRHFWFRALRRHARLVVEAALGGRRGVRIVDCGAGTGRNLDWLRAYGPAVGVERALAGLRVGRARGRPLVRATVTALPFPDASADVATSFDVLYCLDDQSERQAVGEMWRILKPGGFAVINTAALDVLRGSHSALTREVRRYTRGRLAALLTGAGFRIERMTFTHLVAFPPALVVRGFERLTGRADTASDADLAIPSAPVNATLDVLLAVEARVLRVVNLPIGTSLLCVARKPDNRAATAA
jgi:SAM-dependent methyltransferase